MKNIYSFQEFITESWFNFIPSENKKILSTVKTGQLVCCASSMPSVIHVYQMIDPLKNQAVFIGNLRQNDVWGFKLSTYLNNKIETIKNFRPFSSEEKKVVSWYFRGTNRMEQLTKVTKVIPIL